MGVTACADAAEAPGTRVVSCGKDNCLLISGHRPDAASEVRINGHRVSVEGKRNWSVRLPMETVRAWSVPMARTIDVTIVDAGAGAGATMRADLPIGLLGRATNLAALEIRSP